MKNKRAARAARTSDQLRAISSKQNFVNTIFAYTLSISLILYI